MAEKPSLGTSRQNLGWVWRNRKKIIQITNAYLYLPFFLLIILWCEATVAMEGGGEGGSWGKVHPPAALIHGSL